MLTTGHDLGVLGLVFGGCCSNVYVLEHLVRQWPACGDLLTAAQFLFIAIEGLVYAATHRDIARTWKIRTWLVPSLIYFVVCVLNNKAWAYSVSVPVHTIMRSCGTVVSLLLGLAMGKRYTGMQIAGVVLIFCGGVFSTVLGIESTTDRSNTVQGLLLVGAATVLASVQTLLAEQANCSWRESLFMTHSLPFPLFFAFRDSISAQWSGAPPDTAAWLLANCMSQYLCVRGVSMLVPYGALTVSVTLSVRKFVSLLLSAMFYGDVNRWLLSGGLMVAAGALLYSRGGVRTPGQPKARESPVPT